MTDSSDFPQTPAQRELAELIVSRLRIDWLEPGQIDPAAPLFGSGLGLDSIDALELALAISQRYGFKLRSDHPDNARIFSSLAALSAFIETERVTTG
ncbi:MAG: phosphopantetheine-binding protein [Lysobacterales bacterium]